MMILTALGEAFIATVIILCLLTLLFWFIGFVWDVREGKK